MEINNKLKKDFQDYAKTILDYNKIHMLTGFKNEDEIIENLFIDSIKYFENLEIDNKKILDIGSGSGVPGIPLKMYNKTISLTIIETMTKRINFLKTLKNVDFTLLHDRAENLAQMYEESFDIVTMRAVFETRIALEIATKFVKVNGLIVLPKGEKADLELDKAKMAIEKLSLKLIESRQYKEGKILIFKKMKKTDKIFPRNFSIIKKKPL